MSLQDSQPQQQPTLPLCLVLENILPFLDDRATWNRLATASKEIYQATRQSDRPWPAQLRTTAPLTALAVSPHYVACGNAKGHVHVWHPIQGHVACFQEPMQGSIQALSFSSNHPHYLAVTSKQSDPVVWNMESQQHQTIFLKQELQRHFPEQDSDGRATHLAFGTTTTTTTTGNVLYLVAHGVLWKANIHNGQCERIFSLNVSRWLIHLVHLSSRWVAIPQVDDSTLSLTQYDDPQTTKRAAIQHNGDCVNVLAVSPDAKYTATAGDSGIVQVWELVQEEEEESTKTTTSHRLDGLDAHVTAVAFSPDSQHLAAADIGGHVLVWDWKQARVVARLFQRTSALSFTPQGRLVAAGGGKIRVWSRSELLSSKNTTPIETS